MSAGAMMGTVDEDEDTVEKRPADGDEEEDEDEERATAVVRKQAMALTARNKGRRDSVGTKLSGLAIRLRDE